MWTRIINENNYRSFQKATKWLLVGNETIFSFGDELVLATKQAVTKLMHWLKHDYKVCVNAEIT